MTDLRLALIIVWVHLALATLHGGAHLALGVQLGVLQWLFVHAPE